MRRALFTGLALAALAAFAGTRAKESAGAVPALLADGGTTDGVTLADSIGCRASVRVADGGTINGGTLASFYYDPVLGWVRSATSLDCTLQANKLLDGGAPAAQVCPDSEPLARFGRWAVASTGLVGADGGTPNGVGVDGGSNVSPVVRVECWGPTIP